MATIKRPLKKLLTTGLFAMQTTLAISQLQTTAILSRSTAESPKLPYSDNGYKIADLAIGDRVPDVKLKMINYHQETIKLSDTKGRLIILDFWSTTCSNCIANFPKMQILQDSFPDEIKVILVNTRSTGDNEDKIREFYKKPLRATNNPLLLPSVVMDTTLDNFFKHKLIPHYVWIDSNRIVRAITGSKDVTSYNIKKILKNGTATLKEKQDLFDRQTPLFKVFNFYSVDAPIYSSFFTKYIDGIGHGITRSTTKTIKTQTLRNFRIIELYNRIYNFQYNRVILNVKDKYRFVDDGTEEWSDKNSYCYELSLPVETTDSVIRERMRQDIESTLGMTGTFKKQRTYCYMIKPNIQYRPSDINTKSFVSTDEDRDIITYNNIHLSDITENLNAGYKFSSLLKPIFEPDPKYLDKLYSLKLSINAKENIEDLKSQLYRQGFELLKIEKELDMFILSEK